MVELGSGLAPGEKVALNVSSRIRDGELVSIAESTDVAPVAAKR
jgi:hypothetical protein